MTTTTSTRNRNVVLVNARMDFDAYDTFGWVQGWRFALADYIRFVLDEPVMDFWPSPFGPDEDSSEYALLRAECVTSEDARYALRVLDRYRNWLAVAGRDY